MSSTTPKTAESPSPKAKGSNLLGMIYAIETKFDKATLEQVVSALPAEIAYAIRGGQVIAGGWYPLTWYQSMHRASQEVTGRSHELARELAQIFVAEQLGGMYKALLKLVSPQWLFNFPSLIYSRYFSIGRLVVPESKTGFVRGVWSGCVGFDRNIWSANWGGSEAALERAGGKNVKIEVLAGGRDGDDSAEAIGTWT